MYGFETFIQNSRDVYNFIGITLVALLSFFPCNYRFFSKQISDLGNFEQLYREKLLY